MLDKESFKGALSGLRQYLATKIPLKMIFISPLKLFKLFKFLS